MRIPSWRQGRAAQQSLHPGRGRRLFPALGLVAAAGLVALGATVLPGSHSAPPTRASLTAAGGNAYTALDPYRLLDTRNVGQTALGPGGIKELQVTGVDSVPADATAVALNVTATDTTTASYLTLYPTGTTRPTASNVNWSPSQTVANMVIVPTGTGGNIDIYNQLGSVDVVVDLEGYFAPATAGSTVGSYVPLTPFRIADTRPGSGQGYAGGTLHPNSTLTVQVTGQGTVPASGVTAVVLNVTAT
ncbi:MAG TPA: hypothetical protein VI138_08550, partial [Candidatus Dormibacteraeota bacterium]